MSVATFLYAVQPVIVDYLKTDPYGANIHMIAENAQDVASEARQALNVLNKDTGELPGVCISLQMLVGQVEHPDTPNVFFTRGEVLFEVAEHPEINRGADGNGKRGLEIAEWILAIMSHFQSSETAFIGTNFWAARDAITRVDLPEEGITIHQVRMLCAGGTVDSTAVVAAPILSVNGGGFVVMTCATAGATIYYTRDTTGANVAARPTDVNGTAYTVPIAGNEGHFYRARAYKADLRASVITDFEVVL